MQSSLQSSYKSKTQSKNKNGLISFNFMNSIRKLVWQPALSHLNAFLKNAVFRHVYHKLWGKSPLLLVGFPRGTVISIDIADNMTSGSTGS